MDKKNSDMKNSIMKNSIQTEWLSIRGNIMSWDNTMIQLSNVSCISTTLLEQVPFPKYALLLILAGIVMLKVNILVGLVALALAGGWIYIWYDTNTKRSLQTVLSINMNSGMNFNLLFGNKAFLRDVLTVLEKIITEGGIGDHNLNIDIYGCKFSGNAQVLNGLNLSEGRSANGNQD